MNTHPLRTRTVSSLALVRLGLAWSDTLHLDQNAPSLDLSQADWWADGLTWARPDALIASPHQILPGNLDVPIVRVPLLASFGEEGLGDGVEFRRLARKYLRPARRANLRRLYVVEPRLCHPKTLRALQHVVGTQHTILGLGGWLEAQKRPNLGAMNSDTLPTLHTDRDLSWTRGVVAWWWGRKVAERVTILPLPPKT